MIRNSEAGLPRYPVEPAAFAHFTTRNNETNPLFHTVTKVKVARRGVRGGTRVRYP
jgi:hypothetical protein